MDYLWTSNRHNRYQITFQIYNDYRSYHKNQHVNIITSKVVQIESILVMDQKFKFKIFTNLA